MDIIDYSRLRISRCTVGVEKFGGYNRSRLLRALLEHNVSSASFLNSRLPRHPLAKQLHENPHEDPNDAITRYTALAIWEDEKGERSSSMSMNSIAK